MSSKIIAELEKKAKFPIFNEEIELIKKLGEFIKKVENYKTKRNYKIEIVSSKSIKVKKKMLNPDSFFTEFEKAILRDSRIRIPHQPLVLFNSLFEIDYITSIYFSVLNRKNFRAEITLNSTNYCHRYYGDTNVSKKVGYNELLNTIANAIKRHYKNYTYFINEVKNRAIEINNEIEDYNHQLKLIKSAVNDYIAQVPYFNELHKYKVKRYEVVTNNYPAPYKYRPEFNPETMEFRIFEGHREGDFHINTEIRLYENGWIVFTVSTWSKKVGFGPPHKSQNYYFSLIDKKFHTAKKKDVKELYAEELDWYNKFGKRDIFSYTLLEKMFPEVPEVPEPFRICYICKSRLHYPAVPIMVDGVWTYQLRMCCGCYSRFQEGLIDPEEAVEKAIEAMGEYEILKQLREQKIKEIEQKERDKIEKIRKAREKIARIKVPA